MKAKAKVEVEAKAEVEGGARRRSVLGIIPALLAASLVAGALPARAATVSRVIAVVGNDVITQGQLDREMVMRGRAAKGKGESPDRQKALERLINDKLLNQLMASSKIEVSEEDLARAIGNILHQNGMTIEQLRAELSSKGVSYEEYKKEIENQIRRVKFVNQAVGSQVKVSDQDLRDYYQQHQGQFRGGARAHIAQIFLPFADLKSEADALRLKELAISIVTKARRGSSFEELAKAHSKGPNAEKGGDLGTVNLKDLPPEAAETVRRLKVGEVSQPIPTESGLMIVKLVSQPELSPQDFEQLRDQIYSAVYDERLDGAIESFLQKERQKTYVEIR